MRLLIDMHALLWFCEGSSMLSPKARAAMEDDANERFSGVSLRGQVSGVSPRMVTFSKSAWSQVSAIHGKRPNISATALILWLQRKRATEPLSHFCHSSGISAKNVH
jgi:hypothetical protein